MRYCPKCDRNRRSSIKEFQELEIDFNFTITEECDYCHTLITYDYEAKRYKTLDGYVLIKVPVKVRDDYLHFQIRLEHRWVWEVVYGVLPDGWLIHHVNGIKDDNRIGNLIALPDRAQNGNMQNIKCRVFQINCPHCEK